MPTKDETPVPTIIRSEDGKLVHYGFTENGVFHGFAAEGAGNYDERIKAAQEAEKS